MSRRRNAPAAMPRGIELRHSRACAGRAGAACDCSPTYRAVVTVPGTRQKLQRTFPTLAAAKLWREDARVDLRRKSISAPAATTVRDAAEAWIVGARAGTIRNRSGETYKPSAIRTYVHALNESVLPELGGMKLSELTLPRVQAFVDGLVDGGMNGGTVRNALIPLRVICRRALVRGEIAINPTLGLELLAQRGRRDRIASPRETATLLAALPQADRPVWAAAMYAGLRAGELQALRWEDVDLDRGLLRVRRSWDQYEGLIAPKSRAGVRAVPILARLRVQLAEHRELLPATGFVFGREPERPCDRSVLLNRATRIWKAADLKPISLHECRHTFASLMIAAGVNLKALQVFMGHASITVTLDLYGHLMPGSETEAIALADAYLDREIDGRKPGVRGARGEQITLEERS